jgi:para-nitrobenzyl esterase
VQDNPDYPAWIDPMPESEDCLVLNVWAPADLSSSPRPVIVWFHGGGYTWGSAGIPVYDGARLSECADAIVISVNHRLNIFGYLWLGDAFPDMAEHANPGQQDLIAALAWVRDNVRSFGGDPDNVTVMGESGGGAKIGALMATPTATGLFHKAIVQSGSPKSTQSREQAGDVTEAVLELLGGGTWTHERLAGLTTQQLKWASREVEKRHCLGRMPWQPVVEGRLMTGPTWAEQAPAGSRGIPMIVGTTKDELISLLPETTGVDSEVDLRRRLSEHPWMPAMDAQEVDTLLAAYRAVEPGATRLELLVALTSDVIFGHAAIDQLEKKLADHSASDSVYHYEFAWQTPCFGGSWAPHAGELPFVFGNLAYPTAWDGSDSDAIRSADDPAGDRFRLAQEMMSAWGAFARSGNPSTGQLTWPPYDTETRPTMVFGREASGVVGDLRADRRRLVEGLPIPAL